MATHMRQDRVDQNLDKEFDYYLDNQTALADRYEGKVLVIKGQQVLGVFESKNEALHETVKQHELGSFLIQLCSSDPDSTKHTFHSRVRLSSAEPA